MLAYFTSFLFSYKQFTQPSFLFCFSFMCFLFLFEIRKVLFLPFFSSQLKRKSPLFIRVDDMSQNNAVKILRWKTILVKTLQLSKYQEDSNIPGSMTVEETHRNNPRNYRLITCLPLTWKILTTQLRNLLFAWISRIIFGRIERLPPRNGRKRWPTTYRSANPQRSKNMVQKCNQNMFLIWSSKLGY